MLGRPAETRVPSLSLVPWQRFRAKRFQTESVFFLTFFVVATFGGNAALLFRPLL
jgi:hypothetical protein